MERPTATLSPGELVRYWRTARGLSQMALALDVGVSPRHMSFVETGRSRPGRELLVRIAEHLRVPGREENALLEAHGYARRRRESNLADPDLAHVKHVLQFVIDRHEPNSAIVFDRNWDIVMSNEAHRRSLALFVDDAHLPTEVTGNLLRLTFHPRGIRRCIVNWDVVGAVLLERVERELLEAPSAQALQDLYDEVRSYGPVPPTPASTEPHGLLLPVHLRKGDVEVKLFSVLSTIGTAIDVYLDELRIESFFPADAASEAVLAALSG